MVVEGVEEGEGEEEEVEVDSAILAIVGLFHFFFFCFGIISPTQLIQKLLLLYKKTQPSG